jgi:hypothetical protein
MIAIDCAGARPYAAPTVNQFTVAWARVGIVSLALGAGVLAAGCQGAESPKTASPSPPPAPERGGILPSPPDREMPAALASALPKDEQGRPILMQRGGVGLAYDSKIDDPISRWSACLSLVNPARQTARQGGTPWIDLVKPCHTNAGGNDCCPPACIEKFKKEKASGASDSDGIDRSFMEGTCVEGFEQQSRSAQP